MSYSWSGKWPTLTELFFGKGNGPQGPLKAPKKKAAPKTAAKKPTTSKSKEITAKKPAKTEARGTRKDFGLQKKLKEQLKK
jgi:hypothetical protein|tara:strand:- start:2623 stop:2865 length:243 start_codon:yes stop_codon:yes gene_type:complete